LALAAVSCDRGPPEERVRTAATELLEASRARDFEAVHDVLSSSWRQWTRQGLAYFPEEIAAAVDREDEEDRFLAACHAWLDLAPPRSYSQVEEPPAVPPWLFPGDLLESLSTDEAIVEPEELLVWSEEELRASNVPGLSVRLRSNRTDFGAFRLDAVELTFREEDGDWLFEESTVTLRTASEQSPGIRLAESAAGEEQKECRAIVNVLADGPIEVMEAPVALSELAGLVERAPDGPLLVAVDERVPWRRAAEVLQSTAQFLPEIRLAAASPRDGPFSAGPPERRPGRSISLVAGPAWMWPMSFKTLWRGVPLTFPSRPLAAKEGGIDVLIELPQGEVPEIRALLERLAAGDRVPRLVLDAHPDAPWKSVMAVLDVAHGAGVRDVVLARPREPGPKELLVNGKRLEEIGEGAIPPLAPDHDALTRIIFAGK
jgi:biopolymer transport protein ExbD